MKGLVPPIYRPLLWMMPGFAFTIFCFWYPEGLDRRIPPESDSRIWMIVGLLWNYTFFASVTVVVAYLFVLIAAVRRKSVHAIIAVAVGLLAFVPSAWLTYTTLATWFQTRQEIRELASLTRKAYTSIDFGRAENRFCRAKAWIGEESPNSIGRDAA
jgi:hypothetical protein